MIGRKTREQEKGIAVRYSSTNEKDINEVIQALIIAHENKKGRC